MLWTCLYFPALALDALDRSRTDDSPLVVQQGQGRRKLVHVASASAVSRGIQAGMTVSAACALVPGLRTVERDESAEYRALHGIAVWAWQFSPRLSLLPPCTLLLEIAGSRRLVRSLRNIPVQLQDGLDALGYRTTLATAPTPLGAVLLARAGDDGAWIENLSALRSRADRLPLHDSELAPETVTALERSGVRTLGQYFALPRDGLLSRFGPDCLDYLDRLLGNRPDPRPLFTLPEFFDRTLHLPAEIEDAEAVLFAARRIFQELEGFLRARQKGIQRVDIDLLHPRRKRTRVILRLTQPTRDETHLTRLLRERLTRIRLSELVEGLRVRSTRLHELAPSLASLLRRQREEEPLARFLERLEARLGSDTVHQLAPCPDHRPERAWRYRKSTESSRSSAAPSGQRPCWLLPEPRRLKVCRDTPWLSGPLHLLTDPERVESGWWDGADVSRDYFIARDEGGGRFWIFRERRPPHHWYIHGIFA